MTDFLALYQSHKKLLYYLVAIYVFAWGFTPYQTMFLGLALGTIISYYHYWLLSRKYVQFGQALQSGKRIRSLGTMARMLSAGFAVMIALQYPDKVDLIPTVIGLMTIYIVIIIDLLYKTIRK